MYYRIWCGVRTCGGFECARDLNARYLMKVHGDRVAYCDVVLSGESAVLLTRTLREHHLLGAALPAGRPSIKEAKEKRNKPAANKLTRIQRMSSHTSPNGGWGPPVFY